jgi:hypothetical protein
MLAGLPEASKSPSLLEEKDVWGWRGHDPLFGDIRFDTESRRATHDAARTDRGNSIHVGRNLGTSLANSETKSFVFARDLFLHVGGTDILGTQASGKGFAGLDVACDFLDSAFENLAFCLVTDDLERGRWLSDFECRF